MVEQTQVQQVTMKDPEKVEARKRLAELWRRKIEEERAQLAKAQSEPKLTYYGAEAVVAIGMLGVLGYYVYQLTLSCPGFFGHSQYHPHYSLIWPSIDLKLCTSISITKNYWNT